jgi:hypothetical protein
LSFDEWASLAEDDEGELVDGFLEEEELPDPIHGLAVSWLIALFRSWLAASGGFIFGSEVKLEDRRPARQGRRPLNLFRRGFSTINAADSDTRACTRAHV